MSVYVHIGPPKTATTSLQNSVIPYLGMPFEVHPPWTRSVARAPEVQFPVRTDQELIVSDEILGEFAAYPPDKVAARLAAIFPSAVIILCQRDPLSLFYSYYRQRVVNDVSLRARAMPAYFEPATPVQFLARQWMEFCETGRGFFAMSDIERVRAAFATRFIVRTVDFALLARRDGTFERSFAAACGRSFGGPMSWENASSAVALDEAVAKLPPETPARMIDLFRGIFAAKLPRDIEEFVGAAARSPATAESLLATARTLAS